MAANRGVFLPYDPPHNYFFRALQPKRAGMRLH
jgi:hypothetical protein